MFFVSALSLKCVLARLLLFLLLMFDRIILSMISLYTLLFLFILRPGYFCFMACVGLPLSGRVGTNRLEP